jgi:chromosome segregation protein
VLGPTVLVDDLAQARAVVAELPPVSAVTPDGLLLGRHVAVGGPAGGSRVEVQAELEQARDRLTSAEREAERVRFERAGLDSQLQVAADRLDAALEALHASDAELSAVAEKLGRLGHEMRAAQAEADRLATAATAVLDRITADTHRLAELQQQAQAAEASVEASRYPDDEPDGPQPQTAVVEQARAARQAEMQARLELRTVEERHRIAAARADSLAREAHTIRAAQVEQQRRRLVAQRDARVAGWVAGRAAELGVVVVEALAQARRERDEQDAAGAARRAARATGAESARGARRGGRGSACR